RDDAPGILAAHQRHNLQADAKPAQPERPFLEQTRILATQQLEAAGEIGLDPAIDVLQALGDGAALVAQALISRHHVVLGKPLDDHEQHLRSPVRWPILSRTLKQGTRRLPLSANPGFAPERIWREARKSAKCNARTPREPDADRRQTRPALRVAAAPGTGSVDGPRRWASTFGRLLAERHGARATPARREIRAILAPCRFDRPGPSLIPKP